MSLLPHGLSEHVSMLAPPKLPAMTEHVKSILLLTKMQWWLYIIMVFQGGTCYPIGAVAGTAYAERTCSHPYLPVWWNQGRAQATHVMLPILHAYTIQNDPAYLNHLVGMHYNANFACGMWLSAVTFLGQQMKRHINECSKIGPSSHRHCRKVRTVSIHPRRVPLAPNTQEARRKAVIPKNCDQLARCLRKTLKLGIGA